MAANIAIPDIRYEAGRLSRWQLAWPIDSTFVAIDGWEFAAGLEPQWRFTGNQQEWRMATYGQIGYFLSNLEKGESGPGVYTQFGYLPVGADQGPFVGLGIGSGGAGLIYGVLARYCHYDAVQRFEVGVNVQLGSAIYHMLTD